MRPKREGNPRQKRGKGKKVHVKFDADARREYLLGFRRRKEERRKKAKEEQKEVEKEQKRKLKAENRKRVEEKLKNISLFSQDGTDEKVVTRQDYSDHVVTITEQPIKLKK